MTTKGSPDGAPAPKSTKLKTRNVFVDTSSYVNENFAVKSTPFKSLLSLCRMGKASLKLTDVTFREIESNVQRCLKDASKALQTKTRDTRILRNFDQRHYELLFTHLNEDKLCASLMGSLKADFDGAKAEIISATTVSATIVFDKYFQKQAPFGPAKKKEEFPDAFVLTALEDWCARTEETMYVVSSDGDMQSGCNDRGPLFHLSTMGEFVDLVLRTDQDRTDFLAHFFIDNPKGIIEAITAEFEDRMVYLDDQDGDGEPSVNEVELGSAAVVRLEDDEIALELEATIAFTAQVSYSDPDASWDYKNEDLERTEIVPVELTIQFDPDNYLDYQVTEAKVNNGDSLTLSVDEDAHTHWK